MICPNCKKEASGQWCVHCGFRLYSDNESRPSDDFEKTVRFSGDYLDSSSHPDGSRSSIYDDDSSYPYGTESVKEPSYPTSYPGSYKYSSGDDKPYTSPEEKKYSEEYDNLSRLTDEVGSSKKTVIIVCSVIAAVLVAALITVIVIMNSSSGKQADNEVTSSSEEVSKDEEIKKLRKKGDHYMDACDYESAEKIYKQIYETDSEDKEAYTLYTILFNYNKATKSYSEKNYAQTRKHLNKIPYEYENYDGICTDIEYLDAELTKCENTYKAFEKVGELIEYEKYEDASEEIELVDRKLLTSDDQKILDEYRDTIEENLNEKPEEPTDNTQYRQLSRYEAEDLVFEYCNAFVDSINQKNFSIVEPYIHKSSSMYSQQKKVIEYYIDQGTTERFDGVTLDSMSRTGPSSWEVKVTESETIFYSSGKSESKTYKWTYTIEYIDSAYYFTKIQ